MAHKNLLFPFVPGSQFEEGFAWACELARRIQARLFVLSISVENTEPYEDLLHATGYYLQQYGLSVPAGNTRQPGMPRYRVLKSGHPDQAFLTELCERNQIQLVVIDPEGLPGVSQMSTLLEAFPAAVMLNTAVVSRKSSNFEQLFEQLMETATLHRIPNDFFNDLNSNSKYQTPGTFALGMI